MSLNLVEKFHALMVSESIRIWHFAAAKGPQFAYWVIADKENVDGYRFDTLDQMIESAYAHIDPLKKDLPSTPPLPPLFPPAKIEQKINP
jgi:hypothetical protein